MEYESIAELFKQHLFRLDCFFETICAKQKTMEWREGKEQKKEAHTTTASNKTASDWINIFGKRTLNRTYWDEQMVDN